MFPAGRIKRAQCQTADRAGVTAAVISTGLLPQTSKSPILHQGPAELMLESERGQVDYLKGLDTWASAQTAASTK